MKTFFLSNLLMNRIIYTLVEFIQLVGSLTFFLKLFDLEFSKLKSFLFLFIGTILKTSVIYVCPIAKSICINILITIFLICIFCNLDFTQNFFIVSASIAIFKLSNLFLILIISYFTKVNPISLIETPIIKILLLFPESISMYIFMYYFNKYDIFKYFHYKLNVSSILLINVFSFYIILSILLNVYFYYLDFSLLILMCVISNIFLIAFYIIFVIKILDLHEAKIEIEHGNQSYNCLSHSYDAIRSFKHDFSNIMQSIGGYLLTDDLVGLKSYYSSIFKDCVELKQTSMINKDILNSPPVLSLVISKYDKAKSLGIDFNIDVLLDLSNLNMDIYEFTRIFGIFLDNSIEAASSTSQKIINIIMFKDSKNHFDLITIENSCNSKEIDTSKIFEKNFSTKPKNTGLGLWKVKKILKKYDNVFLSTSVSDDIFKHQLKIYY